jgi:hypothetical protein
MSFSEIHQRNRSSRISAFVGAGPSRTVLNGLVPD